MSVNNGRFGELSEMNPDALTCDGLDDAFIGYTVGTYGTVAVYDYDRAIEVFARDNNVSLESATEYIDFNTVSAYVGENTPVFVKFVED